MAIINDENYFAKKTTQIGTANLDKAEDITKLYYYNSVTQQREPIVGLSCKFGQTDGVCISKKDIDMRAYNFGIKKCIAVNFYDPDSGITYEYLTNIKSFKALTLLNQLAYLAKHNDNWNDIEISIKANPNIERPKFTGLDIRTKDGQPAGWLLSSKELTEKGVYKNLDEDDKAEKLKQTIADLYTICETFYNAKSNNITIDKPTPTPAQSKVLTAEEMDSDEPDAF